MVSVSDTLWSLLTNVIQWGWPWVFWLWPLPWLIRYLIPAVREYQITPLIPFASEFTEASASVFRKGRRWRFRLALLVWTLLVLATARPQSLGDPIELPVSGRDLVVAIDISGSMETRDFEVSGTRIDRLTATKAVANAFIKQREGDRIGLILFGSQAYVQVPLTFDRETVQILLNEAAIGLAGKETAIGDAIGLTIKRLLSASDGVEKTEQVLILLTDGANNSGGISPQQAADMAARQGLKIYTIGVGANRMTVASLFGQRQVNPSAALDEETLQNIANKTGGKYFRARDTKELHAIYNMIDDLEPIEREKEIFRPKHALFMWPLTAAVVLAFLLMLSLRTWEKPWRSR